MRFRWRKQVTTRPWISGKLQKKVQFTTYPPPLLRRRRRCPSQLERSRFYLKQVLFRVLTNRSTLEYASPKEARRFLAEYLDFYNYRRRHQALAYQTPAATYYGRPASPADEMPDALPLAQASDDPAVDKW